jgi:hypothetical protein
MCICWSFNITKRRFILNMNGSFPTLSPKMPDPDIRLAGHPCDTVTIDLYFLDVSNQVLQPCKGTLPPSSGLFSVVQLDVIAPINMQMKT